jgi:hypothetical protein
MMTTCMWFKPHANAFQNFVFKNTIAYIYVQLKHNRTTPTTKLV